MSLRHAEIAETEGDRFVRQQEAPEPGEAPPRQRSGDSPVILGVDTHMRSHTAVAVDERGREIGQCTTSATATENDLELLAWARAVGSHRTWAIEDCRALSRRLEEDLLAAGEAVLRVPPKLMADCRKRGRQRGKSDAIDALAVARAALREDNLPRAYLPGPTRELRLLLEHREHLIDERRRHMTRLRWHLHEIDPTWHPARASLTHEGPLAAAAERVNGRAGAVG